MTVVNGRHDKRRVRMQVVIFPSGEMPEDLDKYERYDALIDTGVVDTYISTKIINALPLQQCGFAEVKSPYTGVKAVPTYLARIGILPNAPVAHSTISRSPKVVEHKGHIAAHRQGFRVIEFGGRDEGDDHFDVLLGMDFLSLGSLKIEGGGTMSFSL